MSHQLVIEGDVIEGRKLGRQLGFPTANIEIESVVDSGVYCSRIHFDGGSYWGVTNIGTNPTIGEVRQRAESYLLNFEGDLYGRRIIVELHERLRSERRFDSIEALKSQIAQDVAQCRALRGVESPLSDGDNRPQ